MSDNNKNQKSEKNNEKCSNSQVNTLNYVQILNSVLPDDIRILAYAEVPDNFNARFNAIKRVYKYFFVKSTLDVGKMQEAAGLFIGIHNF